MRLRELVPANNGNVAKSVTAQCLAGYNNSAAAKGIQFFSLYNLATNVKQAWADWTVLPAAKITAGYIIDKVSQAIGNTEFWSLTSGASAPTSVVVAPTAAGVGGWPTFTFFVKVGAAVAVELLPELSFRGEAKMKLPASAV
jgi:hypothetical protein